jgi:outer membrane biosynthesis protein TonB
MEPTLLETLIADKEMEAECRGREPRAVAVKILEPDKLAELESTVFREGTIVCFVYQAGSAPIADLLSAVDQRDKKKIDDIGKTLRARERQGLERAAHPLVETDHLVNVAYGRVFLGRGLAPSLVSVAVTEAIWNGGSLDHKKFTVTDFVKDAKRPPLEATIVLVKPRLTDVEQAVLRQAPPDLDEVYVQGPLLSWTPVAAAGLHQRFGDFGSPLFQQQYQQTDTTQQQQQQQQNDKQVQQQQQQQVQADNKQQQQQQQQQDKNQTVQQMQQQQQDLNQTNQQQQQQQQNAETAQQQQQNQQDKDGHQEQQQINGDSSWVEDDREGLILGSFDRDDFVKQLMKTDFKSLDASASAKTLLRLRRQFLRYGMG